MAQARINEQVASLDWEQVLKTPRGHVVYVCDASESDWNEFVEDEGQELKSTHMEWIDDKIYIVELPSKEHELSSRALYALFLFDNRIVDTYMKGCGRAYVDTLRRYKPDSASANPPALQAWLFSRQACSAGGIDIPSRSKWASRVVGAIRMVNWTGRRTNGPRSGVRYVLCVAVEEELASADYKLYRVEHEGCQLPDQDPIPIVAPQTVVPSDSRLLLGLQPGDAPPAGFPDPLLVDLYAVLERARSRLVRRGI